MLKPNAFICPPTELDIYTAPDRWVAWERQGRQGRHGVCPPTELDVYSAPGRWVAWGCMVVACVGRHFYIYIHWLCAIPIDLVGFH